MVVAHIDEHSDRGYLENIEGSTFESIADAQQRITSEYPDMDYNIYEISAFTTAFNDQHISEETTWLAWIHVKTKGDN